MCFILIAKQCAQLTQIRTPFPEAEVYVRQTAEFGTLNSYSGKSLLRGSVMTTEIKSYTAEHALDGKYFDNT
jgi:hypothetical protein